MDARRTRSLVVTFLSGALLTAVLAAPTVAATCTLDAPTTVDIGSPLTINGSGFPASATVDVSLTIEGGSPDTFSVQADASGAFTISLTPEAADLGVTTIVATAGANCTAQVLVGVGVPAPSETTEPTAAAVGAGAAPRTDMGDALAEPDPGSSSMLWLVAGLLFGIGISGLYATRPARNR